MSLSNRATLFLPNSCCRRFSHCKSEHAREGERETVCESWSPWMGNRQAKLEGSPLDAEVALEESETNFLNFLETWKCPKLISKMFCMYIYISCGKSQTRWAIGDRGDHGGAADGSWGSDSNHMHLSLSERYHFLENEGWYLKAYSFWNSKLYLLL